MNWQLFFGVWIIVLALRPTKPLDDDASWVERIVASAVDAVFGAVIVIPTVVMVYVGVLLCADALGI